VFFYIFIEYDKNAIASKKTKLGSPPI